jgi:hypothetical protein
LRESSGIESTPLYHPPPQAREHFCGRSEPYVFFPSRVEHAKRQELLVRAMREVKGITAVFAGEGGRSARCEPSPTSSRSPTACDSWDGCPRPRSWPFTRTPRRCASARTTRDYGYVTLEAMLSSKPVITCADSGGPLEFVAHDETGLVVPPEPAELARAISALAGQPARADAHGRAGPRAIRRDGARVGPCRRRAAQLGPARGPGRIAAFDSRVAAVSSRSPPDIDAIIDAIRAEARARGAHGSIGSYDMSVRAEPGGMAGLAQPEPMHAADFLALRSMCSW